MDERDILRFGHGRLSVRHTLDGHIVFTKLRADWPVGRLLTRNDDYEIGIDPPCFTITAFIDVFRLLEKVKAVDIDHPTFEYLGVEFNFTEFNEVSKEVLCRVIGEALRVKAAGTSV